MQHLALQQTKSLPTASFTFLDAFLLLTFSMLPFFPSPLLIVYPLLSRTSALSQPFCFMSFYCSFCRRPHACFSHLIPTLLLLRFPTLCYILVCDVFAQPLLLYMLTNGETGLVLSRSFVQNKEATPHPFCSALSSLYLSLPLLPPLPVFILLQTPHAQTALLHIFGGSMSPPEVHHP